jgi:hypothetical protein
MTLPPPRDRTQLWWMQCAVAALTSFAVPLAVVSAEPPPPPQSKPPAATKPAESDDFAVWRALNTPDAIRVRNMPLSQLVETLSKRHKIKFIIDAVGLRRAAVDPDVPVTANTARIPIGTNLRQLLDNLGLRYRVANGAVLITGRQPAVPAVNQVKVVRMGRRPPVAQFEAGVQAIPVIPVGRPKFNSDGHNLSQVELLFVKKVCGPTQDQLRAIKRELRDCFREAEAGKIAFTCSLLPPRIAECVAKHLTHEQATRYRAEFTKRTIHEREGCIDTVIAVLDEKLELSESQRKSLLASLTANWKPGWSQIVELAVRNGDSAVPTLPDKIIVRFLEAEQIRAWQDMSKSQTFDDDSPFNAERIGAVGTPDAPEEN